MNDLFSPKQIAIGIAKKAVAIFITVRGVPVKFTTCGLSASSGAQTQKEEEKRRGCSLRALICHGWQFPERGRAMRETKVRRAPRGDEKRFGSPLRG